MKTKKFKKNNRKQAMASGMMVIVCSGGFVFIPAYAGQLPMQGYAGLPNACGSCNGGAVTGLVTAGTFNTAYSNDGRILNVTQSSPTGILNWQSFNIDKGNTVNFFQPSTTASVLNRIWSADPSIIAGALNANGQVYLINQNGIIFANGAQVNVGALIASSLDISDTLYQAGYTTNNVAGISPAFTGNGGFVRVDTGAVINGSKIMMFAPVVENSGSINSADGQTVLAAGTRVYLEASQDANLRGVLVEVDVTSPGSVDPKLAGQVQNNASGTVSNFGSMLSQRGNTTLIGYAVNQQGLVSATTSVTENGSIKLLARYKVDTSNNSQNVINQSDPNAPIYDIRATKTGVVKLAANSVTTVTPDASDTSTITDSQDFRPSIIEAMGKTVDVAGSIIAPGGTVNLVALGSIDTTVNQNTFTGVGIYQDVSKSVSYSSFLNPNYIPVADSSGARVFLDSSSLIDVSGSAASVSVARNILDVQLRATELANSPLQRSGILYGQTVYIDISKGTSIADYAGAEAQIGRGVLERTSNGGKVLLASTGDVVMNPGSAVNISGGKVDYSGAYVDTTTLISNGLAYDISKASPNLIYDGIFGVVTVDHIKWGATETFYTLAGYGKVWAPGYVQGMAAGSLTIKASNAAIEGSIISNTLAGINQRKPYVDPATLAVDNYLNTWKMLPKGGTLTIGYADAVADTYTHQYDYLINSDVMIQAHPQQTNYALGDTIASKIILDSGLFASGLNNLAIYTNGTAGLAADLTLAPGGSVKLRGGEVVTSGLINAAGGSVDLTSVQTTHSSLAGDVTVNGSITTSGSWVNDASNPGSPLITTPVIENGGNITFNSGANLYIASGTTLDASAGAWADESGKIHGGNGGSISVTSAGVLQNSPSSTGNPTDSIVLKSYGVNTGKGGSLELVMGNDVQIGGDAVANSIYLPASFFQSGGFTSYSISSSSNGVNVDGLIKPEARSLLLNTNAVLTASGSAINGFSSVEFLPDWQRSAASITLGQSNTSSGALNINAGAEIQVDPAARITLNAANQMNVYGILDAPAGTINLKLNIGSGLFNDSSSIWLGANSALLAQGYFKQSSPVAGGLVQGQVLSGGAINISTNGGYVATQQGSVMNVSGSSASIDMPVLNSGRLTYQSTHIAGDAGSISIKTPSGFFDGSLYGTVEAGSQAAAGNFSLNLYTDPNIFLVQTGVFSGNPNQLNLMASGSGTFIKTAGLVQPGDSLSENTGYQGSAFIDQHTLSGFDQVTLKSYNQIAVANGVDLATRSSITLDTPEIAVTGNAALSSAHVSLGPVDSSNQAQVTPTAGVGVFDVTAQLLDLTGHLAVSGAKQIHFTSSGDIRLNGVSNLTTLAGGLRTQGDITFQADQVYTSTLAQYAVAVENNSGHSSGSITIQNNGATSVSTPVLSAGGKLSLSAVDIRQNGVLKAPMGEIDLNGSNSVTLGANSLTSVSAEGQTIPFGLIQGGNGWYYDLTGQGNYVQITTPPQKIVNLTGPDVNVAKGAVVDLSGGGNLYASEFFAGTGGTLNVLNPVTAPANTFAIIPGISAFTPYDAQSAGAYKQSGSNSLLPTDSRTTLKTGEMVYLAGGNGLKAGYYALLPASYALLPGAYRVTGLSGYQDMQPAQGVRVQTDGTMIMAGKYAAAGTNITDARWSGFAVSSGAIVRTQSEFHDSYANSFFTGARLPMDAGQLIVNASGSGAQLALNGTLKTQAAAGGQGAWIDLNGPAFDIVNAAGSGTAAGVQLTTDMLNNLNAGSLLIGGVRTQTANGMTIAVGAKTVTVENSGATLSGPEIMLAANSAVTVKSGSSITGSGSYSGTPKNITIGQNQVIDPLTGLVTIPAVSGNGALLRVSSGEQVTVSRANADGTAGTMSVAGGATVAAVNSVLLDATYQTTIGNTASLTGQAFSVAAHAIDIGNGSSGANSLGLTTNLLAQMQGFQNLTLHSYGDINFYSGATLGAMELSGKHQITSLTLNSQSLSGISDATIDAGTVTLMNNNGVSATATTGSGTLNINADSIVLGTGDKVIQGFDQVNLNAAQQISGQGTGKLTVLSNSGSANGKTLALQGTLTGATASSQSISASQYDLIINPATLAPVANTGVGATLDISAKSIDNKGSINLPSGTLSLHATGSAVTDGVILESASQTSAAGLSKTIAGQTVYAPAGTINLTSDNGNVMVNGLVDVSGAAGGGNAGNLNISAINGIAVLTGQLKGSGANKQGSFTLDANRLGGTLDNLDALLMTGGFNQAIDIRDRSDTSLVLNTAVKAQNYQLAADNGSITVNGKIDASGVNGGNILFAAKNDVTLASTLDASATGGTGGKVTLETTNGTIKLNNGAYMDVSGATSGTVHLRAPQISSGTNIAVNNNVKDANNVTVSPVSSGANVIVEGYKTYTASSITAASIATTAAYYTDAQKFASHALDIENVLGITGAQVMPGIQISSTGDLTLATNWNLAGWRFNGTPGILTLQAAGNLVFGVQTNGVWKSTASLSDGFTSATGYVLSNDNSWSYQLVAGADTSAADVMAVNNSGNGNVLLAPGGYTPAVYGGRGGKVLITPAQTNFDMIRTGTGSIDIAAGGGLYLGNSNAMIYTAGQQVVAPITANLGATGAFVTGGGNINIAVKGDINATGQNSDGSAVTQLFADWQLRQGSTSGSYVAPAWWIDFGSFAQNIGALGGGNVNISAGGNITSLSAVVPTTGYVASPGAVATVLGGGNLTVKAGKNIDSGIFYVGNGQGDIQAGGELGTSRFDTSGGVTLYTILALGQGNINVAAGGDINLQTVLNPTMLGRGTSFFTYDGSSGVSLQSLNGNILLSNNMNFITTIQSANATPDTPYLNPGNLASSATPDTSAVTVYPGTLAAIALNGGISSYNLPVLYPSATGNLTLIAGTDINIDNQLIMSDASPTLFQPATPVAMGAIGNKQLNALYQHGLLSDNLSPLHSADTTQAIIAAGGNINGDTTGAVNLVLPKAVEIQAGQDIVNLSMSVQNQQSTDITSVIAGRDIKYTGVAGIAKDGSATPIPPGIELAGPGQLLLEAGRDISLGQTSGLLTTGNLSNPYLPQQGAGITVLAGLGGNAQATQAFIAKYIDPASAKGYTPSLASYIAANVDPSTATGLANIPYLVSYFFDPSTKIGQANTQALSAFVASNGAAAGLTSQQAYTYLKSLPADTQKSFAYDFFKVQSTSNQAAYVASNAMQGNAPDLISFVNDHGKVATQTDATSVFNSMLPDLQNKFPGFIFKQASAADQIAFVNKNGVKQVATSADAIAAYSIMTQDVQNTFGSFSKASPANQISFVNSNGGVTKVADAYSVFGHMTTAQKNAFVNQVFFSELRQSGRSALTSKDYSAGYTAISTLFPASTYQGNVNLYYSQIKTEQGGAINILTPGGGVNAGLANPPSGVGKKTAAQLGIVTVGGGDVNAYVNNDFTVNQSRVFTLQGGNIMMWSMNGDLDAGKGSKSVSSTPAPQLVVDPKTGTFTFDVTNSVVGSGIGVLQAGANTVPGAVDLYAPNGKINAADAGIRSAGIINLGALTIIANGNITAGGTVTGVPAATSTAVGVSGLNNLQDASKMADQATGQLNKDNLAQAKNALSNFMPSLFSVEVIGLGGENYNP